MHTSRKSLTTYDTKPYSEDTAMHDPWRLTVKLKSRKALLDYMAFHKIPSAYELARRSGLKVGIVGHLVSGRRTSCNPATARAIEDAMQCPPGFLFEAKMSQVVTDRRQTIAA